MTTDQTVAVAATLAFVEGLPREKVEELVGQMQRSAMIEMALRKLVGAVEGYVMTVGRPMTLHGPAWEAMRAALAEGKARLR